MGNVRVIEPEAEGITPCRYFQGIDDLGVMTALTDMLERHITEAETDRDRNRELGLDAMAEWYDGRRSYADMLRKMVLADLAARMDEREQEATRRGQQYLDTALSADL